MKKFISVLLAVMLVLSLTTVAFSAYNVVDADAPTIADALAADEYDGSLAKVYFMMPNGKNGPVAKDDVYVHHPEELDPETGEVIQGEYDELVIAAGDKALSWYNDFNLAEDGYHYAGIYWWDAPASPAAWPGYRMEIDDYDNCVYYAEIPGDGNLTTAIFNNGVDGGTDKTQPIYYKAAQSIDNNMEGAYEGDYETLWGDTYNEFDFDGCIYVIDPDQVSINPLSGKQTCGGNWYFYYGNGCYGNYRTDADEFTSPEDCCLNPDHFDENGNHVGFQGWGEDPTEAPAEPTEAPAEPTEAPAEPTEAPAEPTEAPAEPTEAPAEPTEAPAEPTEAPAGDTYIVAGNSTDIFGTSWNGNDANNTMTYANDVWSKEYTVSGAMKDVQLKAVKNGETWIGDETGNNVTFNLDGEGTFTVYCDGTKTWVDGDIVSFSETLDIESVTLVGNGAPDGDGWLNNISWDPAAEANHMTNTWDSIYEAEYTLGEYDPSDIEFKFAINDAWTHNFGLADGGVIENDVVTDAVYNGSTNLKITDLQPGTTIRIRIDLSNFDFNTKTGADMLVTWTAPAEPTEAPAEPTEAPAEPTEAPAEPTEAPHVHDLIFVPEVPATTEADGVAAHYTCSGCYKLFADASGTVEVTAEELVLPKLSVETKYYIVGNFTDWELKDEYELSQNLAVTETEEYFIDVNLDTDNQFKIVQVINDTQTWYPDGMGNNYGENGEITADGLYTVYFRPNYDGGDDWFYNLILATLHEEQPTEAPVVTPTEAGATLKPNTYYLYGTIASMNQNWSLDPALEMTMVEDGLYKIEGIALKKAELGVDQFGNPIKNSDPEGPEIIGDSFKVVKSSKRGTSVSYYFPDGVDNNRTVSEDGVYTIWFRPAGDGTPEEGWIKVYTMSDPEGDPAAHGATVGGYMYKFEKTGEYPVTEPTEAPAEPTEAPVEPTEAPVEPTEAPVEPTEAPVEPTEAPAQDTYIVAGNATDIFGTSWNGNDANNTMTYANDVWSKEYTVSAAMNEVQLKAVKNGETWIGDETGNNVTFNLTGAGTFTVYCDGTKTWVEGDIVSFSDGLDVQSVTLVGNGSTDGDGWLNNITWDPAAAANHMNEVADGVYEIEFTLGEYDPSDVEFKFAVNDAWTHNFGLADNGVFENGVETDAIYNGSTNLKITGLTAGTTIKVQLDLSGFDFNTKTGAKMTITWGVEEPVPADTYVVAGKPASILGVEWNPTAETNAMTFANDVWSKEYSVSEAVNDVQLKAVKNGETWIGDETGNNVTFNLTGAGTFTVYCDGTKTWVEGDIVEFPSALDVESVTLVGNGSVDGDNWLNNIEWDPAAEANHMTEVSDGVYEIEFTLGEYDTSDPEFKFAINDAWTHNFGLGDNGVFENGVETDAIYNGSTNLKITGLTAGTTIKVQLDLSGFDFNTKTGAKMTITWTDSGSETVLLGDVNNDGAVDILDANIIQRYDAMFDVSAYAEYLYLGDVNGDGDIDILDATLIQRYDAGMTVKYPIGQPVAE